MKFVTQDYYEILSVSPGATNEEVKRAYRLVRQSFRPDSMAIHSLYAPEETEAISAKIDEAFRILSDPELARRYAKYHRSARPGAEVPRDPDVFFDLVHDLDGPSPIEQLARQVGRLSEVRRRADRVAEEPVPVALRSLPPAPRYNPSPVSSTALPAVSGAFSENQPALGDEMEVETDPAHTAIPAAALAAPPDSIFDEPIVARASVLFEEEDEADIEPLSVLAAVSLDEDDEEEAIISFDEDDPMAGLVDSLPSSAFLSPLEPSYSAPAPRQPTLPLAPARPSEVQRPAARAVDPSTLPLPGAQVDSASTQASAPPVAIARSAPPAAVSPAATVPSAPTIAPAATVPSAPPVAVAPAATAPSTPAVAAMSAATAPSATAVAPVGDQRTVEPTPAPEPPANGALALSRRAMAPRRWDRASIRTRAVGPMDVTPLSREVIDSIEMDSGGMNGAFLQKARRELGVAIKDISGRTKISVMMLRYIEADDVAELPAKVYLKGYLTQVARLLKLPAQEFVTKYLKANGIP